MERQDAAEIEWFFFILFGTAIFFLLSVVIIFIYNRYRKNKYLQLIKEKDMIASHQRELFKNNIITQENERKRIANDLHDELGSIISLIKMNIHQLDIQYNTSSEVKNSIGKIKELAENALGSTRRISYELMPPTLTTLGLFKTIEMQMNNLKDTAISVNIEYKEERRLTDQIELGLYRVIMELLNNTIKHSGATEVNMYFSEDGKNLILIYTDNGTGFKTDHPKNNNGMGLHNIESRIDILGGYVVIKNGENKGMKATVNIPID